MRILFICDEYQPGKSGGIGSAVRSLATALTLKGHSVFVAGIYSHEYGGKDFEIQEGIKIWRYRFGVNAGPLKILYKVLRRMPRRLRKFFFAERGMIRFQEFVVKLVEEQSIDIVEIADWNQWMFESGRCAGWPELKVPLVLKLHGSYSYFNSEMEDEVLSDYFDCDVALFKRADAVSAVSLYTADRTMALYKTPREIEVVYNGVNLPPVVKSPRNGNAVIFTGSLAYKKGVDVLMDAWNIVHRAIPTAKLYVCGKGESLPLRNRLDETSKNSVTFTGHLSQTALQTLLQSSQVGCFPSYSETFGLGVVEAMAAGCAVVYGDCGPAAEIIENGTTGMVVPPGSASQVANAIIMLLRDKTMCESMSLLGRLSVEEKFEIGKVAERHVSFYSGVISNFITGA